MFEPQPSITHVPTTREQIVAIIESINQPQVSIPGKAPQAVQGHLVGLRTGPQSFSIFVGLHLTRTGENVIYLPERRSLATVDEYRQVEVEGLHFLESMGFMLDNLNFRNLSADAQDQTLRRIPLFSAPRPASAAAAGGAAPAAASDPARLARLLASF